MMSVGRHSQRPILLPCVPLGHQGPLLPCVPLWTAWAWDPARPPVFCYWVACLIFLFGERLYIAPPFNPLSFIFSPEGQRWREVVVQLLSRVRLFATPRTAARQGERVSVYICVLGGRSEVPESLSPPLLHSHGLCVLKTRLGETRPAETVAPSSHTDTAGGGGRPPAQTPVCCRQSSPSRGGGLGGRLEPGKSSHFLLTLT